MQAQCIHACHGQARPLPSPFPGLSRPRLGRLPVPATWHASPRGSGQHLLISCGAGGSGSHRGPGGNGGGPGRVNAKENVWSVDNDLATARAAEDERRRAAQQRRRKSRRGRRVKAPGGKGVSSRVLVSAVMLVEVETVLQTQEPVIIPAWDTFSSSLSGIWKGVGAVFSPVTAEMEPIGVGNRNENLYDCYVLSRVEKMASEGQFCKVWRKTNWVTLNPFGERAKHSRGSEKSKERDRLSLPEETSPSDVVHVGPGLPSYGSFDLGRSDVLEEDFMTKEPGLVFFEDGSYSRGPVDIPVGDFDESKYYLSPTFKFEQVLQSFSGGLMHGENYTFLKCLYFCT